MKIETYEQLLESVRAGKYAWPGGYPVFFVTGDYEPLSYDAVVEELERIRTGFEEGDPEWTVIGSGINWEDAELYCCHTGERIESAYAEEEAEDVA